MGSVFETRLVIGYDGIKENMEITPSKVADYLQTVAFMQGDSVGYPLNWYNENKKGWMILNWHIKVDGYPQCYDNVTARTWTAIKKRNIAERNFVLEKEDEVLVRAMSRWVFVDMEKRRLVRLPAGMMEKYSTNHAPLFENEDFVQPMPKGQTLFLSKRSMIPTRRDTDINLHVNNVRYIEWAMDDVPDAIFLRKQAKEIRVVYKKECRKNDRCMAGIFLKENENDTEIFNVFTDGQENEIASVWSKWTAPSGS